MNTSGSSLGLARFCAENFEQNLNRKGVAGYATEVQPAVGFVNLLTGDTDVVQRLCGRRVTEHLLEEQELPWVIAAHDHLVVFGINFGLRVSDLTSLRFSHIINDDCTFRDRFAILEKKTKNTRAHKLLPLLDSLRNMKSLRRTPGVFSR